MCGSLPPSDLLLPGERLDDLQCGGYRLIQRPDAFRFGTDSVLLADFAAPRPRTRAVDLGCGTGRHRHADGRARAGTVRGRGGAAAGRGRHGAPQRASQPSGRARARLCRGHARRRTPSSATASTRWRCAIPLTAARARRCPAKTRACAWRGTNATSPPAGVAESAARLLKNGGRLCVIFPAPRALEMLRAMEDCGIAPKRLRTVHGMPEPRAEVSAHRGRARRRAGGCTGCRRWCCARRTAPSATNGSASTACGERALCETFVTLYERINIHLLYFRQI